MAGNQRSHCAPISRAKQPASQQNRQFKPSVGPQKQSHKHQNIRATTKLVFCCYNCYALRAAPCSRPPAISLGTRLDRNETMLYFFIDSKQKLGYLRRQSSLYWAFTSRIKKNKVFYRHIQAEPKQGKTSHLSSIRKGNFKHCNQKSKPCLSVGRSLSPAWRQNGADDVPTGSSPGAGLKEVMTKPAIESFPSFISTQPEGGFYGRQR